MWGAIGSAVKVLASPLGEWLKGRAARQRIKEEGKAAVEKAKWVAREQYNTTVAGQMQFSWKDEVLLIVIVYPFVLSFTAPFIDLYLSDTYKLMPHIEAAWTAVGMAPDWYKWALTGIIVGTYGLKGWAGWKAGK